MNFEPPSSLCMMFPSIIITMAVISLFVTVVFIIFTFIFAASVRFMTTTVFCPLRRATTRLWLPCLRLFFFTWWLFNWLRENYGRERGDRCSLFRYRFRSRWLSSWRCLGLTFIFYCCIAISCIYCTSLTLRWMLFSRGFHLKKKTTLIRTQDQRYKKVTGRTITEQDQQSRECPCFVFSRYTFTPSFSIALFLNRFSL